MEDEITGEWGGYRIMFEERQGKWPDGHENEWKFPASKAGIARMCQRPGIGGVPKNQRG